MSNYIVVTRHPALVAYLAEQGIIPAGAPVISHATADDIKGKDVIGVLPLSLACLANTVTEVPLRLTPNLRGVELSLEQVRAIAGPAQTYTVHKV